jgi:hypothetical protein
VHISSVLFPNYWDISSEVEGILLDARFVLFCLVWQRLISIEFAILGFWRYVFSDFFVLAFLHHTFWKSSVSGGCFDCFVQQGAFVHWMHAFA